MNKGHLAVIHIAKKQVCMSDDAYKDLLGSVGVESSKDLDRKGFSVVMSHFEQLGFKSKSKARKKRRINNLPRSKKDMMRKLEAIILDMDLSWEYVDGIARKRFKVESAQWLQPEDLRKLLQMMIIHQNRQARSAGEAHG